MEDLSTELTTDDVWDPCEANGAVNLLKQGARIIVAL